MNYELNDPISLSAVQTYFQAIQGDPLLADLLQIDHAAFESLSSEPEGWDWTDYNGAFAIEHMWLFAETSDDQARLARICHLRARAWEAALAPFAAA